MRIYYIAFHGLPLDKSFATSKKEAQENVGFSKPWKFYYDQGFRMREVKI